MTHTVLFLIITFIILAMIAIVFKKEHKKEERHLSSLLKKEFKNNSLETNSILNKIPEIVIFSMYALKLSGHDEASARVVIENWFKNPASKVSKDKNIREAYTQVARLQEFVKKGKCDEDFVIQQIRGVKCSNLF